jgi:hypothetical protein
MPRNVRNAWVTVEPEGRRTPIATGPRAANGSTLVTVDVRKNGGVHRALVIKVRPVPGSDKLRLTVESDEDGLVLDRAYDR